MKKFVFILFILFVSGVYAQEKVTMSLKPGSDDLKISKHIYGHFSEHLGRCIYDGYWVDENMDVEKQGRIRLDLVEALKQIQIPNLRWPGGCFADKYHWMDGIGPYEERPTLINSSWGNVTEDNSFGTHEFLELCNLLETEPIICGNVGSGTPQEMSDWVEYLNFDGISPMTDLRRQNGQEDPWKVTYFGVGNESWGCGGNMTPEFYADVYKRFNTFIQNYPDARVNRIAGGANGSDYNWTEVLMREIGPRRMWGLSLHYYTRPGRGARPVSLDYSLGNEEESQGGRRFGGFNFRGNWLSRSATDFDEEAYFATMQSCMQIDEIIQGHERVMDQYDPYKRVALVVDEWGIWTQVEPDTNPAFLYQQNSLRDALIAATHLNIFNNHCDRVKMANLAQTVNVLQAVILTEGEKMLLTPTYHVFDLFKVHQEANYLPIKLETPSYSFLGYESLPAVNASASQDETGAVHITLVNIDPNKDIPVEVSLSELGVDVKKVEGKILSSSNLTDHNTFDDPNLVQNAKFNKAKIQDGNLNLTLPAKSIVMLELK